MAKLRDDQSDRLEAMPSRMLVGRSATCFLRLTGTEVSGEHALVLWTGGGWSLRDLGSRNGTYLDGRRIEVGQSHNLVAGTKLAFGRTDHTYTLVDAEAPAPMALELRSRQVVEAQSGLLALSTTDDPELVIFQQDEGNWVQEAGDEVKRVVDQEVLYVDGKAWCVFLPDELGVTPLVRAEKTMAATSFSFEVSRDEEHVVLTLVNGASRVVLESREHHYLLLILARARLKDAALPPAERGWLSKEELQRMLRMRSNALNVAVHRARQQLADAGLVGAATIVEVRRGLRRFGTDRFEERPL